MRVVRLTPKRVRLLRWILRYDAEKQMPPTLEEMKAGLGYHSTNGPRTLLDKMEADGLVSRRPRVARGIFVTALGRDALAQGGGAA